MLVDLLAVHFFLNFGSRPGHFFGGLGLVVGGIGSLLLSWMFVLKVMGESVGTRPALLLGFFMVVAGLQFLTTGVVAEMIIRIYYDGKRARQYHCHETDALADDEGWSHAVLLPDAVEGDNQSGQQSIASHVPESL